MLRPLQLTELEARTQPSATLLEDLNRSPVFGGIDSLGNQILYTQSTAETGNELWRTDGTPAGTQLLKDIVPGSKGSDPYTLLRVGNLLYFTVTTATNGEALWRTDGTSAGTIFLKTINADPNGSTTIKSFVDFNGQFYFGLETNGKPGQLWKTNGTAAGTVLIKSIGWTSTDLLNDGGPQGVGRLTVVGNTLYFTAETRLQGVALWKTNGTAAGTVLVSTERDEYQDGENFQSKRNIHPSRMVSFNGFLYFAGRAFGYSDIELWKSDGTVFGSFGTRQLKDIYPGSNSSSPQNLTVVGNTLFFTATNGSSVNGVELWKTDGTANGTVLVKDINPGAGSSMSFAGGNQAISFNGKLYFVANNGTAGAELWSSDGTANGTALVKDINPGSASSSIGGLRIQNGKLYFLADDGSTGQEIWVSDGTTNGTVRLVDLEPGSETSFPTSVVGLGTDVYWFANTLADGQQLWKSNGTPGSATMVLPVPNHPTLSSNPQQAVSLQGSTYFIANSQLWKSDGTALGTFPITDRLTTVGNDLVVFQNNLYFPASTTATGFELWKSDGTAGGTALLKDIRTGTISSSLGGFKVSGDKLYFYANQLNGAEPWISDGTANGTVLLKDINPTSGSISAGSFDSTPIFVEFSGNVYFAANDGTNGTELWKTDGTNAGTVLVKDLYPNGSGLFSNFATKAITVGNSLYFVGLDPVEGVEFWKTDGTTAGTVRVTNQFPGYNEADYQPIELNGNIYYFFGTNSQRTLRRLNPTTGQVTAVWKNPVPSWFYSNELYVFGGKLYFLGYTANNGVEIWTSDGTTLGTTLFRDLVPGANSAFRINAYGDPSQKFYTFPLGLVPAGNNFLFTATDGNDQSNIWLSDGTSEGTRLVMNGDLYGSSPLLGTFGDSLLLSLSASDYGQNFGVEPWLYTPIKSTADQYTLEDDLRLTVPAGSGVLANDTDGANRPAKAELVSGPKNGRLQFQVDGSFTYQPFSSDFTGTDSFTYKAITGIEATAPTTVTLIVDSTNQAPTPQDDFVTGRAGKAVTINVLANDRDPDFDSLTISSFTQGTKGKVQRVGTTLRYTPTVAGAITDTFTYTVVDPRGASATATVTVTLTSVAVPTVKSVRVYPGAGPGFVDLAKPGKKVLPFAQLSRVEITFSADVSINADDLRLLGVAGGSYQLSGFSYSSATRTASWNISTPSQAIGNDRLQFLLDGSASTGVLDTSNNPLGNGTWSIGLLAGDFNGDGEVKALDLSTVKRLIGRAPTGANLFADIDGDGQIDTDDLNLATAQLGNRWI